MCAVRTSWSALRKASACALLLLLLCISQAFAQSATNSASVSVGAGAQQSQAIPPLIFAPNAETQGFLAGGQSDNYRIKLEANYYVHLRARFYDVDGVLSLYAPDGQKLEEVALPTSTEAMKELWWITRTAGDYRLEIRASDPKSTGKYSVHIHNLVLNDQQNEKLITAERLRSEGWRLHEIGTQESLRSAIPKLETAVSLWRELGNAQYLVDSTMFLGEVYYNLSEYRKAIEVYQTLFPLLAEAAASDPTKVDSPWVYNNLAASYLALGEAETARRYYEQSLQSLQAQDAYQKRINGQPWHPRSFAIVLTALGNINLQLGEKEKALEFYNQALPYWEVADDGHRETFGLARVYRGLSKVDASLGEFEESVSRARQAAKYSSETSDFTGEVAALNILGVTHAAYEDYQNAASDFKEALNVAHGSGDRNGEAQALTDLGDVYLKLGQLREAEETLNQSLQTLREVGNRTGEARALTSLGMLAHAQGQTQRALEFYGEALPLRRETKDREGEAETLYEMARVHLELNDLTSARGEIEKALEQIELVRSGFAGAEMRASYQSTVQRYYEFYINLLMLLDEREPMAGFNEMAFERSEMARSRSLLERLREVGIDIRAGVDPQLVERERELRRLLEDKSDAQTRLLNSRATSQQKADAEREIAALLDEYRQLEARIRVASPRYASLTQPAPPKLREIQQQILDADSMVLEYSLNDERSFVWAITPTAIRSFKLPKRAEVEAAAMRLYQSLTARNAHDQTESAEQRSARLARAESQYRDAAETLSRMLLGPVASQLGKRRLVIVAEGALQYVPFAALPDPNSPQAPSKSFASATRRDGARASSMNSGRETSNVASPLNSALPLDSVSPLIVSHEIVTLPSVSVLAALRRESAGRQAAPSAVAVFADPVFEEDDARVKQNEVRATSAATAGKQRSIRDDAERSALDVGASDAGGHIPRLIFSRTEALNILSLVPEKERKQALDFQASKVDAMSPDLSRYRIIHFATHALLNDKHPELSGIVLSLVDQNGQPQDGFLRLHDIYNLRLPADLVVLSACQSGLGKEVKGEGMIGLTRGFMYAGVPRVVASLWKIDDRSTAELMKRFYEQMLAHRLPPAAALRAAQIEMLTKSNWRNPYYWAAFVLQGDWR